MSEKISVNISHKSVPVEVTDGDKTYNWSLRVMGGEDRMEYIDTMKSRITADQAERLSKLNELDETERMKVMREVKMAGLFSFLVGKCLRDETGKLVPIEKIKDFPFDTLQVLYTVCMDLNALSDKGIEEVKNESEES